jgi:hypothetical protein
MDTVRWFKQRAKALLKAHRAGDEKVAERIRRHVRNMNRLHLQKIQHAVACEAGFRNWKALIDATDEERQAAIDRLKKE